jgi:hypothetical protein
MPVRIPSELYGGGAFKIDSTAATNYYLAQKAKEEAKVSALDKYFNDLSSKMNPAGVRGVDLVAFDKSKKDFQDFFLNNKEAIAKGNNPEINRQFQQLKETPFRIVAESKATGAVNKKLDDIRASNPDLYARIDYKTLGLDEETGQPLIDPKTNSYTGLVGHDESLYVIGPDGTLQRNPKHKTLELSSIAYNPKLLNVKEMDAVLDEAGQGVDYKATPTQVKDKTRPFGIIETTTYEMPVDNLKKVGDTAELAFSDPQVKYSWEKTHPYDKWVKNPANTDQFNKLNAQFNAVYGRDIKDSKDSFVATAILKKNIPKPPKKDLKIDEDARWMARNEKEYRQKVKLANMRQVPAQQVNDGNAFDDLADSDLRNGIKIRGRVILGADGKPYTSPVGTKDIQLEYNQIPATVIATLKASGIDPDYLLKGAVVEVKDGKIQNLSNKYVPNVTRTGMKVFQMNYNKEPTKGPQPKFSEDYGF